MPGHSVSKLTSLNVKKITAISTQGLDSNNYVNAYYLFHAMNEVDFHSLRDEEKNTRKVFSTQLLTNFLILNLIDVGYFVPQLTNKHLTNRELVAQLVEQRVVMRKVLSLTPARPTFRVLE